MLKNIKYEHLRSSYAKMAEASTLPLWEIIGDLVADEPVPMGDAHIWQYEVLRPLLLEAGEQISAEEAERRVLALKNPGLERPGIAQTLFAGLQLVMPGEIAPAHRHTQAALRFVLESSGGYTAVQGERCLMRRGDLITTPSWCWHDHENTGDEPLIWLDGLDVPLVSFFGAKFAEELESDQQPIYRGDDDSVTRWGSGMRPFSGEHIHPYSPIFSYPYERARAGLAAMVESDLDERHGWKMVYTNPLDGGHVLPTLSSFLQMMPKGFDSKPWRSTESTVFAVVEGSASVTIGETKFDFRENDVFVVPNWTRFNFHCSEDVVLFSFSDRAAQERLGFWREDTS